MKKLFALLTVFAMVLALAGCFSEPAPSTTPSTAPSTEPTVPATEPPVLNAQTVLANLNNAATGKSITAATVQMVMDYAFSVSMEGFSMDMGMSMDVTMDVAASAEPYASYTEMTMSISALGMDFDELMKSYTVEEDGWLVSYTYTDSTGTWERMDTGISAEDAASDSLDYAWLMEAENLSLDDTTQTVGGREAHVLRCDLTMDQAAQLSGSVEGSGDLMGSTGLDDSAASYLTVAAVIYVDTETQLPLQIEMTFLGLDDYLMETMFDEDSAEEGQETTVTVNEFTLVLSNISFDPVEIPAVPQEAYDYAAMAQHDPDQGDGTYLLINQDCAALLTLPDGWEGYSMAFNSAEVYTEDYTYWASYTLYSGMTTEDFEALVNDDVVFYQDYEMYADHGTGEAIGEFQVRWIEDIYGSTYYYAWAPMGDGWIYVTTEDYEGADMTDVLASLLAIIENQEPIA